jgi:hypothetical protein
MLYWASIEIGDAIEAAEVDPLSYTPASVFEKYGT